MTEPQSMAVGDILEWLDPSGAWPHRWRIIGIHLGAEEQESLIEMESMTHKPGWTGQWEYHPILWVPEVLVRHLRKVQDRAAISASRQGE